MELHMFVDETFEKTVCSSIFLGISIYEERM
jgi:hypothetical protein